MIHQINGTAVSKRRFEDVRKQQSRTKLRTRIIFGETLDGELFKNLIVDDPEALIQRKPGSTWPKVADLSLGINPADVPRALEDHAKHGLNGVTYTPEGDPVFSGPGAYKKYLRLYNFYQRDRKTHGNLVANYISAKALADAEELVRR